MQNTVLCTLTEEENSEILALNLRRDTLNEFFLTIANSSLNGDRTNILCEKLYKDMDMVKRGITEWWRRIVTKYNLEPMEGYQWHIEYNSREVTIIPIKPHD